MSPNIFICVALLVNQDIPPSVTAEPVLSTAEKLKEQRIADLSRHGVDTHQICPSLYDISVSQFINNPNKQNKKGMGIRAASKRGAGALFFEEKIPRRMWTPLYFRKFQVGMTNQQEIFDSIRRTKCLALACLGSTLLADLELCAL